MGKSEKAALVRLGRGGASLLLSAALWYFTKQPAFMALAPVLNAAAKWIRSKFILPFIPF